MPNSRAGIEHVAHKRSWSSRSWRVDDVCHTRRHGTGERVGDDRSRCGPGEDLNLTGCIQDDRVDFGRASLEDGEDLVEFCGEQIQRGQDPAIRSEIVSERPCQ